MGDGRRHDHPRSGATTRVSGVSDAGPPRAGGEVEEVDGRRVGGSPRSSTGDCRGGASTAAALEACLAEQAHQPAAPERTDRVESRSARSSCATRTLGGAQGSIANRRERIVRVPRSPYNGAVRTNKL